MKRYRPKILLILLILVSAITFVLSACDADNNTAEVTIANPASVYCAQAGGTHATKPDAEGNQVGICSFSDGQQCDEWALFRGQCIPDLAVAEPFQWCAQGMNSPVMSGEDQTATLPAPLLQPMIVKGLVTPAMPLKLLKASRWRCMTGDVWVCMIGANLPCEEKADISKTASDKMVKFCLSTPNSDAIPAYVTGRATVYEWTCEKGTPTAGNQLVEIDAAGYLSNIWHQLKP